MSRTTLTEQYIMTHRFITPLLLAAFSLCAVQDVSAKSETTAVKAPAAKKPAKPSKLVAAPAAPSVAEADELQLDAAGRVLQGDYQCAEKQTVKVQASHAHKGYFDLHLGKQAWLMKPIQSSTGAIRLEDVKGETLMVQVAVKSMLMNVKTGKRLVDACQADAQKAAAAAEAAEEAASRGNAS